MVAMYSRVNQQQFQQNGSSYLILPSAAWCVFLVGCVWPFSVWIAWQGGNEYYQSLLWCKLCTELLYPLRS